VLRAAALGCSSRKGCEAERSVRLKQRRSRRHTAGYGAVGWVLRYRNLWKDLARCKLYEEFSVVEKMEILVQSSRFPAFAANDRYVPKP
jgi:hypothetical protein